MSVKGICFINHKVVLLKNEHGEWDLPGGKLNRKENPEGCLAREVEEELGIKVSVNQILSAHNLTISRSIQVLVLIYLCRTKAVESQLKLSDEHFDLHCFSLRELQNLSIPTDYLRTIQLAYGKHYPDHDKSVFETH